jgi:hypothetical protein
MPPLMSTSTLPSTTRSAVVLGLGSWGHLSKGNPGVFRRVEASVQIEILYIDGRELRPSGKKDGVSQCLDSLKASSLCGLIAVILNLVFAYGSTDAFDWDFVGWLDFLGTYVLQIGSLLVLELGGIRNKVQRGGTLDQTVPLLAGAVEPALGPQMRSRYFS